MQDKMEGNKVLAVPVTLKGGGNYLLWSRLVKTVIGSKGLWGHVTDGVPKPVAIDGGSTEIVVADQEKWAQEDLKVLAVLQGSLEASILEAYSYCETPKALWETLQKVYGNISNLSRVFEVKRAINTLMQEEEEFTKHLGKFRALWSELEMLRPNTNDEATLMERREQDQVFGLLLTLNPVYKDVIKHMLRSPKLPSFDDVCAQLQKEDDSLGLFGGKGEMTSANQVETVQANKAAYKGDERKFGGNCDHCKKPGHKRSQCWILHPHLKPSKFVKDREGRAHLSAESSEAGSSRGSNGAGVRAEESDVKAMASQHTSGKSSMEHEMIRRSDIDALIKALKDNGSSLTHTLGYSYAACSIPRSLENIETELKIPRTSIARIESPSGFAVQNMIKPLIVDSGASHHMISDTSLIKDIEPTTGHVMIANGDRIAIKGIGNLKLFDKESKAFYMPEFTSNLLSVKKCTTDLHCNVIFSPNDVKFQDIESHKLIGKGVTKGDLYMLEDIAPVSNLSYSFQSVSALKNNALWHARLGHPHVRALNLMLPGVMFKNNECEACILGKHCRTVFQKSSTIYENCFDLVHSDVWTAPCLSRESYKYFVTFIDEKSKYTWITLIKTKDSVLEAFKNFQCYVTNQ